MSGLHIFFGAARRRLAANSFKVLVINETAAVLAAVSLITRTLNLSRPTPAFSPNKKTWRPDTNSYSSYVNNRLQKCPVVDYKYIVRTILGIFKFKGGGR